MADEISPASHDAATNLAPTPDASQYPAHSGQMQSTGNHATGYVLVIADIGITQDSIVTPNGTAPLAGSQWILADRTRVEQKIPTWAIILAIVGAFFFLLGLLFLLVKETKVTGYAEISVRSGRLSHMTQLPVSSQFDVDRWRWLVGQAQSMASAATWPASELPPPT